MLLMLLKDKVLNLLLPFSIFSFTLTTYILTLSRSVYFGDSGEFIAVAKTLGIAHPPGYPLYTMLAHLFTYLPFGNLAFRVNLFSAVTSSLTAVVVYLICLKLTKNRIAAISASLFLAFSYLFWLYSLVAEVFSLNNLFVALIILIAIHILEKPQNLKLFYLLSFVFGLALTNHHTIILLAPALLFLLLATNPKLLTQPKFILLSSLFLFLGLLPYLYLPVRAMQNPPLNWGDPDTLGRFFDQILRREYGTFSLSAEVGKNPYSLAPLIFYFKSYFLHFLGIGIVLATAGLISQYLYNKKLFLFSLLAYLFIGPIFVFFTKTSPENVSIAGGLERFFLASFVIIPVWIAQGLQLSLTNNSRLLKYLALLLVFVPILLIFLNFSKVNQSKNFLYEEMGRKMFEVLPENSLLITFGEKGSMIARYFQAGLGQRRDVIVTNFYWLPTPWYQENLKRQFPNFSFPYDKFQYLKLSSVDAAQIICKEIVPNIPTFIENRTDFFNPSTNKNCSYHPQGPLIRLDLLDKKTIKEELEQQDQNFWQPLQQKLKEEKPQDLRTRRVLYEYANARIYLGALYSNFNDKETALKVYLDAFEISNDNASATHLVAQKYLEMKNVDLAVEWEKKAIRAEFNYAEAYKSLGLIYLNEKGDKKTALSYFRKYLSMTTSKEERQRTLKIIKDLEKNR